MKREERLLVIDDNHSIVLAVTAALQQSLSLPVDGAHDLAEARRLMAQEDVLYKAAVVDLHLPDAKDDEAVDLALAYGIPVVVLTGDLNESLRDAICARPLVDYVVKQSVNAVEVVRSDVCRLLKNPQRKVLIVDDSDSFRDYLQKVLETQQLQVFTADNAASAMSAIESHPDICLTLIDYHMPGPDGAELTNTLRGRFPATEMGIIGITISTDPFVPVKFLKAGASDVLRKPFIEEELVSRVNASLDNLDNIKTIADQANHDYLTQIYNRRYLFNAGNTLFSNAKREHIKLTVVVLDIDFFKKINDTFGHEAGDAALIAVALELKNTLRSGDIVARIGGEEFCVVAVNVENPLILVEHMRNRVESTSVSGWGKPIRVTLSAGFTSTLGESFEGMVRAADTALYQAKSAGRNCSVEA